MVLGIQRVITRILGGWWLFFVESRQTAFDLGHLSITLRLHGRGSSRAPTSTPIQTLFTTHFILC